MQKTIGIIFDFDGTLAPDSTSSFLAGLGVDVGAFWDHANGLIESEGWDPIPVYLHLLLELSRSGKVGSPITREMFAKHGASIKPFAGVTTLFKRLREFAGEIDPEVSLEFYLISSGIGDILRHTTIAKHFDHIWACEFAYDPDGQILFPKNIISSNEKTRFLFHLSKGLSVQESRTAPERVNIKLQDRNYRIPFKQMIYIGDGYTDIPCFALLKKNHGVSIGVYEPNKPYKWKQALGFVHDDRVSSLEPAEYGKHSALERKVMMFISELISRM